MAKKGLKSFISNLFGNKTNEEENIDVGVEIEEGVDEMIRLIVDKVEVSYGNGNKSYYSNRKLTNEQILSMRDKLIEEAKSTWEEASKKNPVKTPYGHGGDVVQSTLERISDEAIDKCLEKDGNTREGGFTSYNASDFSNFAKSRVNSYIGVKEDNTFVEDLQKGANTNGTNNVISNTKEPKKQISDDDLVK